MRFASDGVVVEKRSHPRPEIKPFAAGSNVAEGTVTRSPQSVSLCRLQNLLLGSNSRGANVTSAVSCERERRTKVQGWEMTELF